MPTAQRSLLRPSRRPRPVPARPELSVRVPFAPQPVRRPESAYLHSHSVYAIAHRGGAGLAPENTMAAFRRSYDLGLRYLETDVRVTADGVPVAFHDATVDRTTCGAGKVSERDWSMMKMLDVDGEPIPRIEDVLAEFPDAHLVIDLKEPAALGPLISVLRRTRSLHRVCLANTWDRLMAAARDLGGPQLATTLGWESTTRLVLAARSGIRRPVLPEAEFLHVPHQLGRFTVFGHRLLSMAHDQGLKVMVWTVDDPFHMKRLLDAGADGVITDRPDLLRAVLVNRGDWPQAAQPAAADTAPGSAASSTGVGDAAAASV